MKWTRRDWTEQSIGVTMSFKYTCQRCLAHLRPSWKPRAFLNQEPRRWHSIASRAASAYQQHHQPTIQPATTRRSASTSVQAKQLQDDRFPGKLLMQPNDLFHPLSKSPSPDMRRRAAYIKQHSYCPHPSHRPSRISQDPNDPESRKSTAASALAPANVKFECPDCGIPVYCCEEHWAEDYEAHMEICDRLRQINEDDHDLRSGRHFGEFETPHEQQDEFLINMTNWDTFLYTREHDAINDMRSMRHATRLLTYPVTIGSILHELSPYNIRKGGRLTVEGLKSLTGILFLPYLITTANNL